jgi:hypothetical protein
MFERFKRSGSTTDPAPAEPGGGVALQDRNDVRDREAATLRERDGDSRFTRSETAVAPAPVAPRETTLDEPIDARGGVAERETFVERRTRGPVVGPDTMTAVRERQRMHVGGISWGAALFGFLSAAGLAAILTALLVAAGVAIGLSQVKDAANGDAETIGLGGGILLLIVLSIAWYCGGYVAGRMSRFDGGRQGLAVWAWSLLFAVLVAAAAAIGGSQYNVLDRLNLPRLPTSNETLTTGGAIALAATAVVTLVFAILGGKAGERFHRRIDTLATEDYRVA